MSDKTTPFINSFLLEFGYNASDNRKLKFNFQSAFYKVKIKKELNAAPLDLQNIPREKDWVKEFLAFVEKENSLNQ